VLFLQNHDQIGNRAFGERLHQLALPGLQAATVLLLLSPMIPLMFMGDEFAAATLSVLHQPPRRTGDLVREGRRNEFAAFAAFTDPHKRERIPDPNANRPSSIPPGADSQWIVAHARAVSPPAAYAPSADHPVPARHPGTGRQVLGSRCGECAGAWAMAVCCALT
jgi:1,4-alpha-glucan branching enzyme